jgi:hypothetical protein
VDIPEADELYGLPLRDFVPARDALAKQLRGAGRRDDAAAVKALRRPSVAAWTVNQLMRTQRQAARELLDSGQALLDAQAAVLGGERPAAGLRAAAERQRAAVDVLSAQAPGLLDEQGRGPSSPTLDRVAETLHAVSLDPELHDDAAAGRLLDAHRHVGLGPMVAVAPPREAKRKPDAEPKRTPDAEPKPDRAAERERAARRKAAEAAEGGAATATAARERAEARADAAREALAEAEEALERLRAEEESAAAEARRLRAEV